MEGNEHEAKVYSLDDFRARVYPGKPQEPLLFSEHLERTGHRYEFAEYGAYYPIRDMVDFLYPDTKQHNLIVATKDILQGESEVIHAHDGNDRYIAVERNLNELQELTAALEFNHALAEDIEKPIERMYTASLIARSLLGRKKTVDFMRTVEYVDPPHIGKVPINVEAGQRLINVTSWRIAAGLGLAAVTSRNEELRGDIVEYLGDELESRLQYELSRQAYNDFFDVESAQDECAINDRLLGICNPLDKIQLRAAITDSPNRWLPLV